MNLLGTILTFGKRHFVDPGINNDTVAEMFTKKINPKQIVCRFDEKPFMFYLVKYKYTTPRNNRKEGEKYFVFNTYSPQIDMKSELEQWVIEYNKENPERMLLNVKFLESTCLGYAALK